MLQIRLTLPSLDSTYRAVDALIRADAWNRMETALQCAASALHEGDPDAVIPDVKVLLLVGDSGNAHFMNEIQGLTAFGGISGYIAITVWPTPTVLDRLEAIVAHELHHNARYAPGGVVWNPATVTVGEQVVCEGLADVFASELYGDLGYAHFVSETTRTDDAVLAKVASGLEVTGMQNFRARRRRWSESLTRSSGSTGPYPEPIVPERSMSLHRRRARRAMAGSTCWAHLGPCTSQTAALRNWPTGVARSRSPSSGWPRNCAPSST